MNKFKNILEGIYGWIFWALIIGGIVYFVFLPELGINPENIDLFAGIKEEAYLEGFNAGKEEGLAEGEKNEYKKGYSDGVIEGESNASSANDDAYSDGYEAGYAKGYSDGKIAGANAASQSSGNSKGSGSSGGSGGNGYSSEIAEECDYVLNTNTGKFHEPSCSSAKTIREENREYFTGAREEVIARGFEPCGRCNP